MAKNKTAPKPKKTAAKSSLQQYRYINDWCLEDDYGEPYENAKIDAWCKKIGKKYGIKMTVLQYESSGGGWPEIEAAGELEPLKKFVAKEYYGCKVSELLEEAGYDSFDELFDMVM